MTKTGLLAVTVATALLAGCSKADLRELAKDTEAAVKDAGHALDELAGQAEGPLRETASRALDAAREARQASEEFRKNPTTETRQALRRRSNGSTMCHASSRDCSTTPRKRFSRLFATRSIP